MVWWCGEKADQVGPSMAQPASQGFACLLAQGQDP